MRILLILILTLPVLLSGADMAKLSDAKFLQNWKVRHGAALELANWPDGNPGFCGKLTLGKFQPGGEQWPAIDLPAAHLGQTDWSFLKELQVTIYTEKSGFIRLSVSGADAEGKAKSVSYNIALEAGRNAIVIGREAFADIPLNNITTLNYFMTRPESEKVFYIGDMTAEFENPQEYLQRFYRQAEEIRQADFSGLNTIMKTQAQENINRLNELEQKLKSSKTSVLDSVKSGLQMIHILQEYRQLSAFMALKHGDALAAGWVPPTEKVFRNEQIFADEPVGTGKLAAAGNEREGIQLVVYPLKELKNVRVETAAIPGLSGAAVSIHPVGYVWCEKPSYPVGRSGWMPDPICEYAASMDLEAGKYQSYYLDIKLPPNAPKGVYKGEVRLNADGIDAVTLPFELRVFGFSLPDGTPYPLATSKGAVSLGKHYPPTAEGRVEYRKKCFQLLLDYRISPDDIYRWHPAEVAEAREILKNQGTMFNIIYVQPGKDESGKYPEPHRSRILKSLERVVPQYAEAGILDRAYIYGFDEAGPAMFEAMRDIFGAIKEKYPDIPIMTTAYDNSFGIDSELDRYVDIWVPLSDKLPLTLDAAARARERGRQIWWYVCIAPLAPYANLMIEYPAIDGRLLMGMMSLQQRPQGFLYYCVSMWRDYHKNDQGKWEASMRKKYMNGAPLTDWPGYSWQNSNGDGNWTYPAADGPIPSLRLKNINDGLEDYFYWDMLSKAAASSTAMPSDWLKRAEKALRAPDRIVKSLTEYQRDFNLLQRERLEAAELLEKFYELK